MSIPFARCIGKLVVFGAADGKTTYRARVLDVARDGWVQFWWPNSGGRFGWRNANGYIVHKVES